jgi:hypothetical protein
MIKIIKVIRAKIRVIIGAKIRVIIVIPESGIYITLVIVSYRIVFNEDINFF